jgi:N-acetyl-anhydromuramyl-L-alanine amidase AmpD
VGFALPPPLPEARCALTAPFHPCRPASEAELRRLLAAIGYALDGDLARVVTAFQRRYRPARCDGALDAETRSLAAAVARLCGEI